MDFTHLMLCAGYAAVLRARSAHRASCQVRRDQNRTHALALLASSADHLKEGAEWKGKKAPQ